MNLTSVAAYEELARRRLPPDAWGYYSGDAGNQVTARRNLTAFERIQLLHRMLRDDLEHAMVLAGCADLSEVGAALIRMAG